MTDWEISYSSGQWLDKTSTYQMKEPCTHCAPLFSITNKKIRLDS